METIAILDDYSLGLSDAPIQTEDGWIVREAARVIIFNQDHHIALLHAQNFGYHKLPGGGIEQGESWQDAALREAIEETGFRIKLRPIEIGKIIEYRARSETWRPEIPKLKQISYCGIADIVESASLGLTDEEIRVGLVVEWMSLDEAIRICQSDVPFQDRDQPDNYEGRFIQARDLMFLRTAKTLRSSF